MKLIRIAALGAAAIILSIGAVACGDDGDSGYGDGLTPSAQPTNPPVTTSEAKATEPAGEGASLAVTAADFSFAPAELKATAGEPVTVTLTNSGDAPHTLTVYEDEAYTTAVADADTGTVAGGGEGEFTATFEEAKVYYFRCDIHPSQMQGTITVE